MSTRESQDDLIGRHAERNSLLNFAVAQPDVSIFNLLGPGGIGKTSLRRLVANDLISANVPYAWVDCKMAPSDEARILTTWVKQLRGFHGGDHSSKFKVYDKALHEHLQVIGVLENVGNLGALFDAAGNLAPAGGAAISKAGRAISDRVRSHFRNRALLDRYLNDAAEMLTAAFFEAIKSFSADANPPAVLLIVDSYERSGSFDDWYCRSVAPRLSSPVKLIVASRDRLERTNFDWTEHSGHILSFQLDELSDSDARLWLRNHGLTNKSAQDRVLDVTGGYPLLLVLAAQLQEQSGGWDAIDHLGRERDRDEMARALLDRILDQPGMDEMRSLLERVSVASWINPRVVAAVMEVDSTKADGMYGRLLRHSFMERHEYGLVMHDRIRELLDDRLRFSDADLHKRLALTLAELQSEGRIART